MICKGLEACRGGRRQPGGLVVMGPGAARQTMRTRVSSGLLAVLFPLVAAGAEDRPGCVGAGWSEAGILRALPPGALPATGPPALAPLPTVGDVQLLVILAEFADVPHRADPQRFLAHVFGDFPSVREYYLDVSQGLLDVGGSVVG